MSSAGQGIPPFAGGLPTSRDLASTIVFLILYGLSIPLLVYRLVKHFNKLLIRPAIFCAVRLGAFGLRAYMAKAFPNYILSEVIAEIILISIGYLFLCDSLVALWQANVETHSPLSVQPSWIQKIARILRLLLLLTIILTIVSANLNSSYESNNSTGANIRHASYCLSFAVAVVTLLAVTLTYFELNLDSRRTANILIPAISLIIAGIYRVVNSFSTNEADAIRNLASFWCMQALFEFVAYMSFLAISVPEQYPAAVRERERDDSRTSDNTMVPIDNPRRQPKQAQSPPV